MGTSLRRAAAASGRVMRTLARSRPPDPNGISPALVTTTARRDVGAGARARARSWRAGTRSGGARRVEKAGGCLSRERAGERARQQNKNAMAHKDDSGDGGGGSGGGGDSKHNHAAAGSTPRISALRTTRGAQNSSKPASQPVGRFDVCDDRRRRRPFLRRNEKGARLKRSHNRKRAQ